MVSVESGPFFLVGDQKDFPWIDISDSDDAQQSADERAGTPTAWMHFDDLVEAARRDDGWEPDPTLLTAEEAMERLSEASNNEPPKIEGGELKLSRAEQLKQSQRHLNNQKEAVGKIVKPLRPLSRGEAIKYKGQEGYLWKAFVLYGRHLFEATFSIRGNGFIEMLEDEPLHGKYVSELRIEYRKFDAEMPLLLTLGRPLEITPKQALEAFFPEDGPKKSGSEAQKPGSEAQKPGSEAQKTPPSNVRITGDLDLSGRVIKHSVKLSHIEIDGDLNIEDTRAEFSVQIKHLRVRGRLHGRNFKCEGSLRLPQLWVGGYYDKTYEPRIDLEDRAAINLSGARISGRLDMTEAKSKGRVDMSEIVIERRADLKGFEIDVREPLKQPKHEQSLPQIEYVGFSMRGGQVGGDLLFSADPTSPGTSLALKANLVSNGSVDLSGVDVKGALYLQNAQVKARWWMQDPNDLPLSTEKFRELLSKTAVTAVIAPRTGKVVLVEPRKGGGDLDLSRTIVARTVHAAAVSVEGDLIADHLRAELLADFSGAKIRRDTQFQPRPELGGDFKLDYAQLNGLRLTNPDRGHTRQPQTHVCGDLHMRDARLTGSFECSGLICEGDFTARGLRCDGDLFASYISVGRWGEDAQDDLFKGDFDLLGMRCSGTASFVDSRIKRGVLLHSAHIEDSVGFGGVEIGANLNASNCEIGKFFSAHGTSTKRTHIKGDMILSGSTVGSDTILSSIKVDGQLQVITGAFQRLIARPEIIPSKKDDSYEFVKAHFGDVLIQSASFRAVNFAMLEVTDNQDADEPGAGSVTISDVKIAEDLRFFYKRPALTAAYSINDPEERKKKIQAVPAPHELPASIAKNLELQDVDVLGEVDITNLKVGERISVAKCSAKELIARAQLPVTPKKELLPDENYQLQKPLKTTAKNLVLDRSTFQKDVLLTGVEIKKDVSAKAITVDGDISFVSTKHDVKSQKPEDGAIAAHAKIGGSLDLTRLQADGLHISGDSFLKKKGSHSWLSQLLERLAWPFTRDSFEGMNRKSRAGALKLERAKIGRLSLYGAAPFRADIQFLDVQHIECEGDDTPNAADTEARTHMMLRTSYPFSSDFYNRYERLRRDEGDDVSADRIYRQMRWRSADPSPLPRRSYLGNRLIKFGRGAFAILSAPVFALLYVLLGGVFRRAVPGMLRWINHAAAVASGLLHGFWTNTTFLLGWLIALSLPMSIAIFSIPQNIAPSTVQLGEEGRPEDVQQLGRTYSPPNAEWNSTEIARVVIDTHLPIIPLVVSGRWEPTEQHDLCLYAPKIVSDYLSQGNSPSENGDARKRCNLPSSATPDAEATKESFWRSATKLEVINTSSATAAGYAMIVRTLHWIAWPIFLLGVSGAIQRRTNKLG